MRSLMTTMLVAGFTLATQAATPIYIWELANTHPDLTATPSSTDLITGFTEVGPMPGDPPFMGSDPVLSNEVLNESFLYRASDFFPGIIWNDPNADPNDLAFDPNLLLDSSQSIVSILFGNYCLYTPSPDDLLFGVGNPSNGFFPGFNGDVSDFTNGVIGPTTTDGLLRDFGRASAVFRYGFASPTDIGVLRVIGGNINDSDTRTFHNYDVWVSTDGLGPAGTFTRIASQVKSGELGFGNINDAGPDDPNTLSWFASMTEVRDNDSKILAAGVTDLRIVFYCTGSGSNTFTDPWNAPGDAITPDCPNPNTSTDPEDVDGIKRAFVAPVIQEIDVLGPNDDVPWGDIDYNDEVDMIDAAAYQNCSGGLATNGCYRFDQNENSSLDSADLDSFEALMNGPVDPTAIPDQFFTGVEAL